MSPTPHSRRILVGLLLLATACTPTSREPALPSDLRGTLVHVCDRSGAHSLFAKRLPDGKEQRLTAFGEDTLEPALSPDGRRVAFSMGGRIGVVSLQDGSVTFLTLGVAWKDSAPSFLPDGQRLVAVSRRTAAERADLYLLTPPGLGQAEASREPLLLTPGLEEESPAVSPEGTFVVYVRDGQLFRLDLGGSEAKRLTAGFRTRRQPRFLPSGRVMALFTEGKRHGLEVMDEDGANRSTLFEGTTFYRELAPSTDGRYLAATFAYDLGSDPTRLLRTTEELWLLDLHGRKLGVLEASPLHSYHSAAWAP